MVGVPFVRRTSRAGPDVEPAVHQRGRHGSCAWAGVTPTTKGLSLMLFHDPLYVCAALVDSLAQATPGLAQFNPELARQLAHAATPLMESVARLRFASGKRWYALRQRAHTQAEQVLALVLIMDAHRYLQPFPGHRDELIDRARHLVFLLDKAQAARQAPHTA
jgi:hypothetical protein